MNDRSETLESLRELVREFVRERAWEVFHRPKNLAMSIAIEAAELMEHFQWTSPDALSPAERSAVAEEMADVLAYLLALANALDIDLGPALRSKMESNRKKYPVDAFRGRWGSGDHGAEDGDSGR